MQPENTPPTLEEVNNEVLDLEDKVINNSSNIRRLLRSNGSHNAKLNALAQKIMPLEDINFDLLARLERAENEIKDLEDKVVENQRRNRIDARNDAKLARAIKQIDND